MKSNAYDTKREAFAKIKDILDFVQTNQDNGTDVWLVNPNGYNELLNVDGFSRQQYFALFSIFCLIILLSGGFFF